jgi:hypothetical protein
LSDGSYVIFVGGRRKLCNFHLVTSIGQGPTEDKMKPTKKSSFVDFGLSSMEVQQFPVVQVCISSLLTRMKSIWLQC